MKVSHASTLKTTPSHSAGVRDILRMIAAVVGWPLLVLGTLVTGYFVGWILYALARLGRVAGLGDGLPILLVFFFVTVGLAWLMGKFVASARTVRLVIMITLGLLLVVGVVWIVVYPDQSVYWARQLAWGDSTLKDYELYPQRPISNAAPAFQFKQDLSPRLVETIEYRSQGTLQEMEFEEFLRATQTTSFIVIRDDTILYEGYFNGYDRDSIVRSFSVAKSFTSALVGIAIDEGYIGSVDDLMIAYLPEMKGRGFDNVTIRDLLMMSAGIEFVRDDEVSALAELTQFTDEGLSYTYPNLRSLALRLRPDGKGPGAEFNYNDYHPLLLGMILERTTGRHPAEYLQEKLWQPLGMEYTASWSLDSETSGFEQMGSGINGRAIDFAKFGRLFLNNGDWNGTQIISKEWASESTMPDPNDQRAWHPDAWFSPWKQKDGYYKYLWWGQIQPDGSYDYTALGHLGQYIYVDPQARMVVVRFGHDEGGVDDWVDVFRSVVAKAQENVTYSLPANGWSINTPEEQGFDSAKIAEGLLAIKENGTLIHSLMVLRNDKVILDAYFYPYDGSIYHDLASVTKSVMTTLIGIAADQGKLSLDDTMLSFFPDREIANLDERKPKITIGHLASMSSGLDCDRIDDEITMNKMRASDDWVQYSLDLPVVKEPGEGFTYCGVNMHLLSAILQKATGMSALDFAQKNLFGPLGIEDVYWPADPQGVTHGWGDLCLKPADMAKLGSLYLHNGQWQSQQIISRRWVESALQAYKKGTGRVEDYGYGWWIGQPDNEPEFLATGNAGQKIKVYPRLNLIIVMTGGGFEYSEIEPYMLAGMSDMSKPLPPNLAGVASLNAALSAIAKTPDPQPVPPLPATARDISGQTFIFESNPILLSMGLDFNDPEGEEAILQLEVVHEQGPRLIAVGLDGVYRPSHAGRPIFARGEWIDEKTFVIDYNEGPGLAYYTFRLHFDGDTVIFEGPRIGTLKAKKP